MLICGRILDADVIVAVFPVYWQSVPAVLKGWIDRVWNYGFAYGRSKPRLAGKRILWLGPAGATADDPIAQGMQSVLEATLERGHRACTAVSHAPPWACSSTPRSDRSASTPRAICSSATRSRVPNARPSTPTSTVGHWSSWRGSSRTNRSWPEDAWMPRADRQPRRSARGIRQGPGSLSRHSWWPSALSKKGAPGYSAREGSLVREGSVTDTGNTRPADSEAPASRPSRLRRLMRHVPRSPPSRCGPCPAGCSCTPASTGRCPSHLAGTALASPRSFGMPLVMARGHGRRQQDRAAIVGDTLLGAGWVLFTRSLLLGILLRLALTVAGVGESQDRARTVTWAVLGTTAVHLTWGYAEARRVPRVRRLDAQLPRLGAGLDGLHTVLPSPTPTTVP